MITLDSYMTDTAASWWYTIVQSGQIPPTWEDFKALAMREFILGDHKKRTRDKLQRFKQSTSMYRYTA